jgi:hypothetical protein
MSKKQFLQSTVEHVDITSFDARPSSGHGGMSFSAQAAAPPTFVPWSATRNAASS